MYFHIHFRIIWCGYQFQGAIKTNDVYVGNVMVSAVASADREAVIAVPVYSLKDNSTIIGVWGGSIDFGILNKELQSLKIPSGKRVVYTGYKGQKVADSDITKKYDSRIFCQSK